MPNPIFCVNRITFKAFTKKTLFFFYLSCYNVSMLNEKLKKLFKIQFGVKSAIILAFFVLLLASDLILKWAEEAYDWNFTVIPNWIWVESGVRNNNIAFGLGETVFATASGKIGLIVATSLFCLVLALVWLFIPERFTFLKVCLAMIVAGAIGNVVDRAIFFNVRDFVWLNMLFTDACCNFADFWIVIGAVLMMVDIAFLDEFALIPLTKKAKEAQKEDS